MPRRVLRPRWWPAQRSGRVWRATEEWAASAPEWEIPAQGPQTRFLIPTASPTGVAAGQRAEVPEGRDSLFRAPYSEGRTFRTTPGWSTSEERCPMSNPEPEIDPTIPPTVPDRDLGLDPMTPEQLRRLLSRRYPSTSDLARYLTRDRRVPANGRDPRGDQSEAVPKEETERLGVVVNMPIRSSNGTDESRNGPYPEAGSEPPARHARPLAPPVKRQRESQG